MKKLIALVVICLAFQLSAWAQPSFIFPSVAPDVGQSFCVDVKVKDFTDILSMDFSINWDPAVIEFESPTGFNLPGLTAGNFDASGAANGFLTLSWRFADCAPNAMGVTQPDGTVVFRLCFKALAAYGATSPITITNNPVPIRVTRVNACPSNIGLVTEDGIVSIGVRAVMLIASQEEANEGDLVCVDYSVIGFDDLTSMQFSINWDPTKLEFDDVIVLENLVNLAESSFGTPDEPSIGDGTLTVSWSFFNPDNPGVSVVDSTVIFQVCYRVIGDCETTADINFADSPTPIEVGNIEVPNFKIKVVPKAGAVKIGKCNPTGLKLFADCGDPVNPNDTVCVQISTAGFTNVKEFSYLLEWNENVLELIDIKNINTAQINGFDINDFNRDNEANGILGVSWSTSQLSGVSLPGGSGNLYELCFKVIGVGGGSPIQFKGNPPIVKLSNGSSIGINPTNCAVDIIEPQGVVMNITNGEAPLGDTVCVDVSVSNFKDILSYQFSLVWEPSQMEFVGVKDNDVNLPEGSLANFGFLGVEGGSLTFDWEPSQAHTLADGTVIFSLCFKTTGEPQICTDLTVVDLPLEAEAINTTSNGNNIGVVSNTAEVCILFPEGFFLDIGTAEGDRQTTACVPFKVASFDNILSYQHTISFDPSSLEFDTIRIPGNLPSLTLSSFDLTSVNVGIIKVNWSNATAVNLSDSTTIFELCFNLIGTPEDCYEISVGEPNPTVNTANGEGSIISDPGEICIKDRLIIESVTITPASCPDTDDGEIEILVSGGAAPVGITWEGSTAPQFGPKARNLAPGFVEVTIFDNSNPALILKDTFEIPLNANLPTASAGEDLPFSCNPPLVALEGQGSDGANFAYNWTTLGGALPADTKRKSVIVLAPGIYIFEVTNTETGCVARDTMQVTPVETPTADAGTDKQFTCSTTSVALDGQGSSVGDTITYQWTAQPGGIITPGTETLTSPTVTAPGTYVLRVVNSNTGCSARDTVIVKDERVLPNAVAGADQELGCDEGSAVVLDGTGSIDPDPDVPPLPLSFEWLDGNGEVLSNNITFETGTVGTYYLRVTNLGNACVNIDTISVLPNEQAPTVDAGTMQLITCITDTVSLTATVGNSSTFVFEWTATEGGQFVTGTETSLTPQVSVEGLFQLMVKDTATNCTVIDTVRVGVDKTPPTAEAGTAETLTCSSNSTQLDGTGSSDGDEFAYQWMLNGQMVANTLQTMVSNPGVYYLQVLNQQNGCTALDSVSVDIDGDVPQAIVPPLPEKITCLNETVSVVASIEPANPNYIIEWTPTDGGNILSGANTLTIEVDKPGTYQIKVTNPDNGCEGTNEVIIEEDKTLPEAIAGEDTKITCETAVVTLSGQGSAQGDNITYEWTAIEGGLTPPTNNTIDVQIDAVGLYQLLVTDIITGCSKTDTIRVEEDKMPPMIAIAQPDTISCQETSVSLDATASAADVVATWTGLDGGTAQIGANQLIADVTQGGRYELRLVSNANGCEARDTVVVEVNADVPQLLIADPAAVTCINPSTTLDATESTINGAFTTQWTAVNGNGSVQPDAGNPLRATVTPGAYQLVVKVTATGCESSTTIEVAEPETPMANAASAQTIECGGTAALDGTGSSSGANITYQWSVLSGTGAVAAPTALTTTANAAGSYQLIVRDSQTGCSDTTTVNITLDVQFELANAGADAAVCEPSAALTANLPQGTTGRWTTTSSAAIDAPTQSTVNISNLQAGDNRFVWTLSATGCADYSADTVVVKVESAPVAADDATTLKEGETTSSIFVAGNDQLANVGAWTVKITNNPVLGAIAGVQDGKVAYIVKPGVFGEDEFTYEICSVNCPTFCDSAFVQVTIPNDPNFEAPPRNNGITPNADGLNDQLMFEELEFNPDQYPDNELIIFNRWGDIVFKAKPYVNDWQGTNMNGQKLPEGTYYYILRLNISEGIIIRGDVTILR